MQSSLNRINLIKNQLSASVSNTKAPKVKTVPKQIIKCALNYLDFDDFLTPEEKQYRTSLRNFLEREKISEKFTSLIETQSFDLEIPRKIVKEFPDILMGLASKETSIFKWASILMELGRCDVNLSSFFAIQSELCIKTLYYLGSETQKAKYLNKLISLELVGCWGLTEPNFGSDASSLASSAVESESGWILNGQKRWIGNGTIADIYFLWARNQKTKKVQCFIVEKGTKGLTAKKMESKLALRAVQNADITFENVSVPIENCLPGAKEFKDTNKVLLISRLGVTWTAIGVALGVYDAAIQYVSDRRQFGKPLAAFQLTQIKLGTMLANVQAMLQYTKRVSEMFNSGKATMGKISLCKGYCTKLLRETVALAREVLGGNGILMDYKVMKSFVDAEVIYTYEGSYDINMLVAGSEITGIKAFN